METNPGLSGWACCQSWGNRGCGDFVLAIELKPERFAESGKRPFGGIGLGRFEGDIMHLAG